MSIAIFFLLGLAFGFAAGWPWGLLAFVVPLALILVAADRSGGEIVLGLIVTTIGLLAGFVLGARAGEQRAP
jgi:hypothetical protein